VRDIEVKAHHHSRAERWEAVQEQRPRDGRAIDLPEIPCRPQPLNVICSVDKRLRAGILESPVARKTIGRYWKAHLHGDVKEKTTSPHQPDAKSLQQWAYGVKWSPPYCPQYIVLCYVRRSGFEFCLLRGLRLQQLLATCCAAELNEVQRGSVRECIIFLRQQNMHVI
jgi:hypothetical protein